MRFPLFPSLPHQLDEEFHGVDFRIVPGSDHALDEKRNRHNSEQVGCHGQQQRQRIVPPSLCGSVCGGGGGFRFRIKYNTARRETEE